MAQVENPGRCVSLDRGVSVPLLFVAKAHLTLFDPMDYSTPGFPVLLYVSEFVEIHVH